MSNRMLFAMVVAVTMFLNGCGRDDSPVQVQSRPASPDTESIAAVAGADRPALDQWLGQWNGPEGTFLLLAKDGDLYTVKIQALDGAEKFDGIAAGDHIEFTRGGKTESIRATSGKETGMKWLLDKQDCLTIKSGEGFCRG